MVPSATIILAVTFGIAIAGKHDIYSRYSVHRIAIATASQNEVLHELESSLDLDVWQHGAPSVREAVVMVSSENAGVFLEALDKNHIPHSVHHEDVAQMFEAYDAQLTTWRSGRNSKIEPFEDFPRYAEVDEYLESLAEQYPDLVTLVNAGPSYDGRDVKYIKISTSNFTDASKPIYFMDAGIHAREWVTVPVALHTARRLLELSDDDQDLLNDIDWIILPIVNPDGYEYSHTNERLWRRTRSYNDSVSTSCYGADANRNFDVNFNTVGVSSNPCAQTYPGTEPFSEPETSYVRDIMFEHLERIQLYLNIHSHGNWILYGYGDASLPSNSLQVFHVGATMGAAIDARKLPQAQYYRVGNSATLLYPSSGSAQDYGQFVGIPFSYTLELPGYSYWFEVPPQYITQINAETWHGIAASARLARAYYRARL